MSLKAKNFDCEVPRLMLLGGVFLVFTYSFLRILCPTLGSMAGTILSLSGLFFLLFLSRNLRSSFSLFLFLLILISQTISWLLNYWDNPEWVPDNPQLDRIAKVFIFIPIAWWLGGDSKKVIFTWLLGVLGVVAGVWFHSNGISEWMRGIEGTRVNLGIRNWQHSSMLLGVCFIGLSVFFPRVIAKSKLRILKFFIWAAMLLYCLVGLYVTQTRSVFFGLLLGFVVFFFLFFFSANYSGVLFRSVRSRVFLVFFLILSMSSIFFFSAGGRIFDEFSYILPKLVNLQLPLPDTSFGVRLNTWVAAVSWISEKPLFGWGGEGRGLVIDYTPWLSDWTKDNIGHLHNYILEVFVSYGMFGVVLIFLLYGWLFYVIYSSWKRGYLSGDLAAFGLIFSVYWTFINQFESYLSFWTGVYVHNIIFGGFVSIYWLGCLKDAKRSRS